MSEMYAYVHVSGGKQMFNNILYAYKIHIIIIVTRTLQFMPAIVLSSPSLNSFILEISSKNYISIAY